MNTICVIGGGVGGVVSALEIAASGRFVHLIEKADELLRGSSDITPGRIGLGFHYPHLPTALYTLRRSIQFVRRFGRFRQNVDKPNYHPLRRGRYFITKNSQVSADDILHIFEGIRREYRRLVNLDQENMVFGSPEDIFRILPLSEYENDVNCSMVELGIETAEEFLDWRAFRKFLLDTLRSFEQNKKLKIHTQFEIFDIKTQCDNQYIIQGKKWFGQCSRINNLQADVIVNATWSAIGEINKIAGVAARARSNRVKVIATLQLPKDFENKPSMFFCMGPYGMFSNKGAGVGLVTYAPVTNRSISFASNFNAETLCLSPTEKEECGLQIVNGIATWIPKLANAKVLGVRSGVVQAYAGETDQLLTDKLDLLHAGQSGIHCRNYSGVEKLTPTFLVNSCMKLIYCLGNAEIVKEIIVNEEKRHVLTTQQNN